MVYRWFFSIVFLCIWKTSTSYEIFNTSEPANFDELKFNMLRLVNSIAEWLFPLSLKVTTENNISMSCKLSLLRFFTDFKRLKEWALKMFDANAKPSTGLLQGRSILFGDYDECLDIFVMNAKKKAFQGQYCMVHLKLPEFVFQQFKGSNSTIEFSELRKHLIKLKAFASEDVTFFLGLCVPSTCTAQEVNRILHVVTRPFGLKTKVSCEIKMKREPNIKQIVILCILSFFGFLAFVGTSLDLIKQDKNCKKKSGDVTKLLIAFSIYSNTVRLFRTSQKDTTLSAIRGCRVLTTVWIVLAHTYFFPQIFHFVKYSKLTNILKFPGEFMFRTITKASLAVDTFFVLSGMLFVYTTWRKLEAKGWINPITYLPPRMARVLIIEMLVIALLIILPLLGNGPIWEESLKEPYSTCVNNWWTNLLFIQNFWPLQQICLLHTWFIGTLFQLNLLTFGVPLFLYRWPRFGISINVLLILIGCFVTAILTLVYDLPATLADFFDHSDTWGNYHSVIHRPPYTYFGPYCIGMFLGYAIVTKRHLKMKLWIRVISWLLATCGALVALYGDHFIDIHHNNVLHVAYAALHRIIWSSSVSWVLFACIIGDGGIIGKLLSWKGMIPLDKLCFFIYLLHPLVMYYYTASTRAVIYLSHVKQVYIFLATTTITVCLSYLCNIIVEQPLNYLRLFISHKFSTRAPPNILEANVAAPSKSQLASLSPVAITSAEPIVEEYTASKSEI